MAVREAHELLTSFDELLRGLVVEGEVAGFVGFVDQDLSGIGAANDLIVLCDDDVIEGLIEADDFLLHVAFLRSYW